MRAAVIEAAGEPPVVRERERPTGGSDAVTIAVRAAPITPLDLLCASGTSYFGCPALPYVPGVQGVGTVESGSASLRPGTLVWFATAAGMAPGDGSMSEVATAPERDVVALDPAADPVLIAGLGLSAVAAWMALTWRGGLRAGERVLVLGAGGVVGQSAIQLARLAGAGRVIAAARSAEARERAARLGADEVVALHATDGVDELAERMAAACAGPVDLVLDPLFGVPAAAALRTLGTGGRLVNLGSSAAATAPLESAVLRSRTVAVLGYTNNELSPDQRRQALEVVAGHATAGRLTVDREPVPLTSATEAWGRTGARVVLTP
ncbi:MAG TPA: zinc-binding alcohol dehydrogenase family protein [Pseudonocardia sp.]|nr:zinc-binding alcohol dehydrogenase family protein [Pseudonocardia sp.]